MRTHQRTVTTDGVVSLGPAVRVQFTLNGRQPISVVVGSSHDSPGPRMSENPDIEQAVLEGTAYELIRAQHGLTAVAPIPTKIRWCGGLLFVGALLFPIVLLLPESVHEASFDGTPLSYPLGVALLLIVGVGPLTFGGVGLSYVHYRIERTASISEDQAWTLVGLEDVFSGLAILTGGLAVFATVLLALVGLAGVEPVTAAQSSGVDPYAQSPVEITTVPLSSSVSGFCGVIVLLFGRWSTGHLKSD